MSRAPSLTVRLAGGLGNQLFMYAAARRMSVVSGVPLDLDIESGFRRDYYRRGYGLGRLIGPRPACGRGRSYSEPVTGRPRELLELARWRYGVRAPRWIVDDPYRFETGLLDVPVDRPTYVRGYFQSERYFADVAAAVREEIRFAPDPSEESRSTAARIESLAHPVAVHARLLYSLPQVERSEELPSRSEVTLSDSVPDWGYYREAACSLSERLGEVAFLVFSDHPDLAASSLELPGPTTVVQHNSHAAAWEDLWLMSKCRHHVLCASTFGWWGAWLAEHSEQIVIAPTAGYPNRDMMPERWELRDRTGRPAQR